MTGNKLKTTLIAAVAVLVGLTGCQDLDVENPNAPNREQALATPGDVASLIGGAYLNYFQNAQGWAPGPALSVSADEHTSSWGNFGMKQFGNEPRLAIDNNPAWSYAYVIENTWYRNYGAISAASSGLKSMEEGVELDEPARARAFAKFMQGLSHANLAAIYDQAFIFDETVDLATADLQLQPYSAVMDAAMGYFQQALDIASNNSFTLPEGWINGRALSSDQFARVIHSYMARYLASEPRGPDESVDWAAVASHVDQGIEQDFWIQGEGRQNFTGDWWSQYKSYGGWFPIWGRTDLRLLGKADTSGNYQSWEATPAEQRQPFLVHTPDRRVTGADGATSTGMYVTYYETIFFVPGRGTYHFSNYGDIRYPHPSNRNQIIEIGKTEMDLLKAEALLKGSNPDTAQAVDLINQTRTENGELPPVEHTLTHSGVPESSGCVPQDVDGNCGSIMEALQWEKRIENWHVSAGVQFWDLRRWGKLISGTPLHWPIPGAELQVLQKEIYTYGGGGEGSAALARPGDLSLSERVQLNLQAMRAQRERLSVDNPLQRK